MHYAESLTLGATVVLGMVCTTVSAGLMIRFLQADHAISRAVAYMVGAESLCMGIVTMFAASSLWGAIANGSDILASSFPHEVATSLRWVMMVACLASTVHLAIQVDRLVRSGHSKQC